MKHTDLKIRALEVMQKYGVEEVYATADGNCFIPSVKSACEAHAKSTGQKIHNLKKDEILSEQTLNGVETDLKTDLKIETVTENKQVTEAIIEPTQTPAEPTEVENETTIKINPKKLK